MLHFQTATGYKPSQDQTYTQQASVLPISNSIRSGRGISISMSGRSKGEKSHSRENRKPIFQKNTSFNSSQGFNSFKGLDRKQSNRTDIDSSHNQARRVSPIEQIVVKSVEEKEKENQKVQQYCNNLLNLMKEQLQISITSTQSRMNDEIRRNNEQLLKLEAKLKQNETLLSAKEQEVIGLRDKLDKSIINKANPNSNKQINEIDSSQFNRNFEYITSKLRDIDIKVRTVVNESTHQNTTRQTLIIYKLEEKIDLLTNLVYKQTNERIQDMTKKLQNKFSRNIDETNSNIQILLHKQASVSQTAHKYEQMEKRLCLLQTQFKNLLKCSDSKSSKQIKYDNSQLKSLKNKVEQVLKSVHQFENEKHQINEYLKEIESQHSNLVQQIKEQHYYLRKQQERLTSELSKSQGRRKSATSINNQNVSTQNLKLTHSKSTSERQHFDQTSYFDDNQSVPESQSCSRSLVLKRLTETIRSAKYATPLLCEVDETGYLKYQRLGTYLFDTEGNLFQLTKSQMALAVNSKIIKLS